jgi:hypothetical protein
MDCLRCLATARDSLSGSITSTGFEALAVFGRNVDRSQLKLAVDEAIRRGLIARREIDRLPHDELQRSLQELAGQPA